MSFRKFLQLILPTNWAEDMERESRSWMIQCVHCKYEKSVWDSGGVRWKAAGTPRVLRVCVSCGQKNWHLIYKKQSI